MPDSTYADRLMADPTRSEQIVHGSVSLNRTFDIAPGVVFAAFATPDLRSAWFRIPGTTERLLDFRVGGGETVIASSDVSGRVELVEYHSRFVEIEPGRRVVHQYESAVDGRRHAIALVTVELAERGTGTMLTYTDQHVLYVHAGGADRRTTVAHHEGAIRLQLNGLAATLRTLSPEPPDLVGS
jgi:uncharacterized protein YndB with AHSA1/START domain